MEHGAGESVLNMSRWTLLTLVAFSCFTPRLHAEQTASIELDASGKGIPFKHVWSFFGYDEPNFTYSENGRKLLADLSALSPVPVYIRTHNLLTSGDGSPGLKWGSTNAYREDSSGRPTYDWTIIDRIFDTYAHANVKPLVEVGFMPEALSIRPQPYRHTWPNGVLWTGWAYPPKDYQKWAELVYRWVNHATERYGRAEVQSWYWEVWNEPDIGYWQGSLEEYCKLYDYTVEAIKRALPEARVGGPHSTGPADPRAAEFLRRFLEHCARGRNHVTGGTGSPLDFIAFHAKGNPQLVAGHVRMGIKQHLQSIAEGFRIISSSDFGELPVILGESDPEGCAACSARQHPQNAYRNGTLYPCYTAEALSRTLELAVRERVKLEGVVTWAFLFENQPYFEGFRTLRTNGIDKPILNLFRMLGLMGPEQLPVKSSRAVALETILAAGIAGDPDINAIAARGEGSLAVLIWNYHDDDLPAPSASVEMVIKGLPIAIRRARLRHYRIDAEHSNAYAVWKRLGRPEGPTAQQYSQMLSAGQLQELTRPQQLEVKRGEVQLHFELPRHAVSLLQLAW